MRKLPTNYIRDLWNQAGPFIGDAGAPHGRVTVEIGWQLQTGTPTNWFRPIVLGNGHARWFQRADNSQTETEIPNIKTITIDRSIDAQAATCKIDMYNQKMLFGQVVAGTAGESVNQPGYFTFNRGESVSAQTRWGWDTNEWNEVLTPNALIRTYQGYGGRDKTISQAVADGNIVLTGVWSVDDVNITTSGTMELSCRDMMKLAIDQEIYPPLTPTRGDPRYPLYYYRWKEILKEPIPYGTTVYQEGWTPIDDALTNPKSTSQTENSSISGHTMADATDGLDSDTYWLSAGHVTSTVGGFGTSPDMEWIEWNTGNITFNGLAINPYLGNYLMFVSVMVGGVWQGVNTIPYTGSQYSGQYEPKIHFTDVMKVHWELPEIKYLSATYTGVQKIRLTFEHLAKTSVGPKYYRCGLRQIEVGNSTRTVSGGTKVIVDIIPGSDTEDKGYWIIGNDGGVFTYGPDRFFGSEGSARLNQKVVGGFSDDQIGGYALAAKDGGIFTFGDVPYKGSLPGSHITSTTIIDIEKGDGNPAYKGYWLLQSDGAVFTFGNAHYHGNAPVGGTPAAGIARCASGGYWIVDAVGHVFAMGGAPYHGNAVATTFITDIVGTSTGNGYWITSIAGEVFAFGDATYHGGTYPQHLNGNICAMAANYDDDGYWLVGEDGGVFTFGSAHFHGSLPQQADYSTDGNYTDYADIVKDLLLWSGWWRYIPGEGNNSPADVFGNIDYPGIYSPQNITEDYFDKKPVIDVINSLKEIVGYIVWVDEIGGFHFETPNVWSIGNFLEDGTLTSVIPVIDEQKQIIQYDLTVSFADARSSITIASADPLAKFPDTISTTINSQWGGTALKGIIRPALWVNGAFVDKTVQANMASLIDLHLFMQTRQGKVTIPANPILQINDQIRIYERQTSDTYVHYLRGYTSTMDLDSGKWTMDLQTHWMGDGNEWFLSYT